MKMVLRVAAYVMLAGFTLMMGGMLYMVFFQGRAPAPRPELVLLPEGTPPPPGGYPTRNAVLLAWALGRTDALDIGSEVATPPGVVEEIDVEYGHTGERPLTLDLYRPQEPPAEPVPGILMVHGGSWRNGDKSIYKYYTVRFAQQGYVAATVGYRLIGEAIYPAAVQDVNCAIRWMRAHADELGVDPDRIVVMGGSAGGHLAMMAAYAEGMPHLEGECPHEGVSSEVAAVVNLYGPTDITQPRAQHRREPADFLGATYQERPDLWAEASPITHLDENDPPTLIIHGTVDQIVEVTQGDDLAERLQELGIPYWYDRIDGWPHALDISESINERVRNLTTAFIETYTGEARLAKAEEASR